MNNLAIIPARSGSKGLRHKNIKPFAGMPLLAHTILAAKESGMFSEIFLSTDSKEYADIGIEYGASVPFLRDADLASDTADSWSVVRNSLKKYAQMGKHFDTVALLQPTSPLRSAKDISGAYALFEQKKANAVVSLCEADHSPLLYNHLPDDASLDGFLSPKSDAPRQQHGAFYRINGAIYIVSSEFIQNNTNLYSMGSYGYIMPKNRSVDIDDETDFFIAEALKCRL